MLPEICIALGAILVLIMQLIVPERGALVKRWFALAVLAVGVYLVQENSVDGEYLNGILWQDYTIRNIKVFMLMVTGLVLLFPNTRTLYSQGEYLFFVLMILLGAMVVIQTTNLLIFYLGIEIVSITSYILIAFGFKKEGFEAGIKYLLFGALSSGIMLYGISLIYGLSGSLQVSDLLFVNTSSLSSNMWLVAAISMFGVGLLFKLALAPMHIWTPDVYQAGPTAIVGYLSVIPKVAVLTFILSFLTFSGLGSIDWDWQLVLVVVAIASMTIGNFSALRQSNIKRLMAYSSIAHAGFLLVGVVAGGDFGVQTTLFYLFVYGLMNLSSFYFIAIVEKDGVERVDQLAGLGRSMPVTGVAILIVMVALVGLPPTSGFTAKLLIFSSLWQAYAQEGDAFMLVLMVVGILNAGVSLFYYLKIPYFMFVKAASGEMKKSVATTDVLGMTFLAFLVLLIFFKPDLLLNILNQARFAF